MFPALSPGAIGVSLPFEECARLAAQAGFQGISVDVGADTDAVRRVLEGNKLRPAAWGLPVDFRRDEESFRGGLAALPDLARKAKLIGATRCSTWILPFSDELTFDENFARHRDRLRPCAEVLAEYGCRLGLEFVGPKTLRTGHAHDFIHDLPTMLELCTAIGTGNVGLLFDAFHWHTSHGTVEDISRLSDSLVVDTHINDGAEGRTPDEQIDNDRRLPGESGVIDLEGWLKGLKAIGYTGPVTPEPFSAKLKGMTPEEAIRTTADALLGVWEMAGV
jgi:sugar phosphate isomerase/epimerase